MTSSSRNEETHGNAPASKPGYRTTEFWLTAAAAVTGLLISSGIVPTESAWAEALGLVAAALASMGYSVSRGAAKRGAGEPKED